MPQSSDDSQQEPVYLSTAEAAARLNLSEDAVRELCKKGMLPGSSQEHKKGPWHIPLEAVNDLLQDKTQSKMLASLRAGRKRLGYAVGILLTIISLLAVVSVLADWGGARRQLQEWGVLPYPLAFSAERKDETLIVIANFYHTGGVVDTEAHNEIKHAIERAKAELGFASLRVEVEPTHLQADDRAGAEALGKRYNASIIIWGADTGVRVTVNFLNLKQPDFYAAQVKMSETERTQLANPSAYARFVTQDLPGQLTFLSLFAVGQSYVAQAQYDNSLKAIEKAVASLSAGTTVEGLAEAYFWLGWLYNVPMGNNDKAIANYDLALKLKPGSANAYTNRGAAYGSKGDYARAIADFDRALKLNPDDALAYNNRGTIYKEKGEYDRAIADLDQALKLRPDDAAAYYNRGSAYASKGDYARAIEDFDQSLKLRPDDVYAYNNRGAAHRQKGEYDRAIADLDQALKLKPDLAEAYINRGVAYADKGEYDRAIADFDQALKLKPDDAAAYYNRGLTYYSKGYYDLTIADFDQALQFKPDWAMAYNNRGVAYSDKGEYDRAIADYDQALKLKPDLVDAYNNRGVAYLHKGEYDHAIADCDQALKLKSDYVDAYVNRGNAHALKSEYDRAIADFDQALKLKPAYAVAYHNRGLAYRDKGDTAHAIADLRRYLELLSNAPDRKAVEELIQQLEAQK